VRGTSRVYSLRLAVWIALVILPGAALAQQQVDFGFEANRFHPATSQRTGYFTLDSGRSIPGGGFEIGLLGMYANDIFVANRADERIFSVVAEQWVLDLMLAWAPIDNFQLSLDMPFYLSQSSSDQVDFLGRGSDVLEAAGVGDLRVTPKWTFLRGTYGGRTGFDMGLLAIFSIPIGDSDAFQGEEFRVEPRLAAEFLTASQFGVGANLGFLIRTGDQAFSNVEIGNQLTWGLGLKIPLVYDLLQVIVEANGAVSVGLEDMGSEENPLEILGGFRLSPGDVYITAGAGTGLTDGYGNPDLRVFLGLAYSTGDEDVAPLDSDGDGILDMYDDCPFEPEDFDGFEDEDGCPDPDNDGDGILDIHDRCPNDPEDFDGFEDEDGCPEEGPVTLRAEIIEITQQIQFDYDSARIRAESGRILDAVADILRSNPDIRRVRIEGHTSTEGSAEHNLELSRNRANAVLEALVTRGVERSRLTADGYGATRPLIRDDQRDPAALETNRRVEFHIVERSQ
jgi:outer membrane protein OmpA-like peptidoglycan-associated protein